MESDSESKAEETKKTNYLQELMVMLEKQNLERLKVASNNILSEVGNARQIEELRHKMEDDYDLEKAEDQPPAGKGQYFILE